MSHSSRGAGNRFMAAARPSSKYHFTRHQTAESTTNNREAGAPATAQIRYSSGGPCAVLKSDGIGRYFPIHGQSFVTEVSHSIARLESRLQWIEPKGVFSVWEIVD